MRIANDSALQLETDEMSPDEMAAGSGGVGKLEGEQQYSWLKMSLLPNLNHNSSTATSAAYFISCLFNWPRLVQADVID